MEPAPNFACYPLTSDRWDDFVELFGPNGASQGCWCMFWRLAGRDFQSQPGETNKAQMRVLVDSGIEPGLLGYLDGKPAGWIALAPRQDYLRLANSRNLKAVDEELVWSLPCFFIGRVFRKQGLTDLLLKAAIEYARQHGARLLEAYPKEPLHGRLTPSDAYTGVTAIFEKAGFREVARHVSHRPIMRLNLAED